MVRVVDMKIDDIALCRIVRMGVPKTDFSVKPKRNSWESHLRVLIQLNVLS